MDNDDIPKDLALVRFRYAVEQYGQMWEENYPPRMMQEQLEEIMYAARQVILAEERENNA